MKKLIVYQGKTKTGKEIIIRYPKISDSEKMCEYINILSKEKTFISFQGECITQDEERKFLQGKIKAIKNKNAVKFLVFHGNQLVAISGIDMKERTSKHIGVLGISVAKNYRGDGIGKLLMELTLKEAKKEISKLKIVTLEVYSSNLVAQNLYSKLGFNKYGRLPNGVMREEKLEDAILMYKNIR